MSLAPSTPTVAEPVKPAAPTPDASDSRRWIVLTLLSLGMMIAYVDRLNLSIALAVDDFVGFFALSDSDRGLLNSAFFWSYALLQIPAGWVVDRYGSRRPFAVAFFAWSLISAATALAGTVGHLFTIRLLLGMAESVVTPASMQWIRYHFAEKNRGLALGIYTSGSKIGTIVGGPLAALLIEDYGWQEMFLILGLGGLLWLLPWMVYARDDPRQLGSLRTPQANAPRKELGVLDLLRCRAMWGIIVGAFCYSYFFHFYMTWLPAYFREARGLSVTEMGWYTMFSFTGMALVVTPAGWLSDRIIARGAEPLRVRKYFTIAGMVFGSTELLGALSDSNSVALFFAVVSLAGLGFTTANYWALTQSLMREAPIGRVIGIQNCANSLSGVAAALITGWLKEFTGGYLAPMVMILVVLLVGIWAYAMLAREEYAPHAG
ncbi:MAG: MFS transporter [Acidobacteria bacterium]|nr:MFS transporter [Acidobacteriota bacterium]